MIRYDSYKDSGIEWIGKIPTNWDFVRGKFVFQNKKEINNENQELNLLSLTLNGVLNKDINSNEGLRPTEYSSYQVFEKNDLVFKLIDLENQKTSRVGLVHERGIMSPVYIRLESKNSIDSKYSYYYYYDLYKQHIFNFLGSGVRSSLTPSNLLEIEIPLPPLSEQEQIVSFLDTKTSLIDSLIEKTQQKIELLKEKRTSIINEVVTKGLNPKVEMKDSGVEWIGDIPSHWTYGQVRRFTIDHRQGYYSTDGYTNSGHRVVRITDLKNNNKIVVSDSPYYEMSEVDKERYELKKGDFLFQRTGSHKKIGVFSSNEPSVYGSFLIRFRFSKKINHEYLRFFFNSSNYKNQLNQQIHGGVNPNIHVENIKECYTTSPPLEEQQQIVEYLDEQTYLIDNTISIEEKRVELLKEYRQSLISEVVTGKRKVV